MTTQPTRTQLYAATIRVSGEIKRQQEKSLRGVGRIRNGAGGMSKGLRAPQFGIPYVRKYSSSI